MKKNQHQCGIVLEYNSAIQSIFLIVPLTSARAGMGLLFPESTLPIGSGERS